MEVGVGDELRGWVLSFGAGAEVIAPDSLRADVAAELARAGARYGAGARP
jgi:predicted DNA-binding transcriptional regulator YafY